MAHQFNVGDVVQLKSGGPKMTVNSVSEEHAEMMVHCTWFVDSKELVDSKEQTGRFVPATLQPVSATESFGTGRLSRG
jgi:uncharacterized protein YodC (DUF2158 family)